MSAFPGAPVWKWCARCVRPGRALACLMLTMHAEESTFNAAMDAGAQGYLLKDDAMDMVLLGLKAVAAGGVYLSPTISDWLVRRQQRTSALKEEKTGLAALTATERRVLQLVAENKTNKEIAAELVHQPIARWRRTARTSARSSRSRARTNCCSSPSSTGRRSERGCLSASSSKLFVRD